MNNSGGNLSQPDFIKDKIVIQKPIQAPNSMHPSAHLSRSSLGVNTITDPHTQESPKESQDI